MFSTHAIIGCAWAKEGSKSCACSLMCQVIQCINRWRIMMSQLTLFSEHEVQAMHTASVFEDADAVRSYAPSLFTTSPHPKMSQRYSFTNTYDILLHMHNKGFKVTSVMGGARRYGKVLVRMRHPGYDKRDNVPELCLLDSHDGTSRIKTFLGVLRLVCMNGCVAGDMVYERSYVHVAPDLMEQILLDLDDLDGPIVKLQERVDKMKAHKTNIAERIALADVAIKKRFGEDRAASFIADMRRSMLKVRRDADESDDIYTVMNVIQENILRGGMQYATEHSVRRVTAINSVDRNMNINQVLWSKAEELISVPSPSIQPVA